MKKHIALLIAFLTVVSSTFAASYSTAASVMPKKGQHEVIVAVSRLVEKDGKVTEVVISQPKVFTALGETTSVYSGLQPTDPNYQNEENVSVVVSWAQTSRTALANCAVTVKLGDKVVSKSKLQLHVDLQRVPIATENIPTNTPPFVATNIAQILPALTSTNLSVSVKAAMDVVALGPPALAALVREMNKPNYISEKTGLAKLGDQPWQHRMRIARAIQQISGEDFRCNTTVHGWVSDYSFDAINDWWTNKVLRR